MIFRLKCLSLAFIAAIFGVATLSAQDNSARFRIHYILNRPEVDSTFVDNTARITDMRSFLESLRDDSLTRVSRVRFRGTASPDGCYEFNVRLSQERLNAFKTFVGGYISIPDSIIDSNSSAVPWDEFRKAVEASDISHRDEVLAIIDEESKLVPWFGNRHIDARLIKLKNMYRGSVWEQLKTPILRDLRYGEAVFEYYRMQPALTPPQLEFSNLPIWLNEPPVPSEIVEEWTPRLYIKTNLIGLALLSANVAVEVDLARHWSVTLPVYYCGMDWFKSTIKFRNVSIQPEARYWFRDSENDGFFVGGHFGMSYFNFAFDGKYRYQDYKGRTPALGGGLSAGYRMPVSRNGRWRMEFSIGAGIYNTDYSLFNNTSDVRDGEWVARRKRTYIGLDQAAVSLAYSFDLDKYKRTYTVKSKKGGRR